MVIASLVTAVKAKNPSSQTSHLKLNLVQFPTMINGEDRWEQCIRHLFFLTFPPPQVSQRTKGVTLPLPDADDAKMRRSRRCIFGTNDERASEHHVQVPTDTVSIIITERPKQTLRNLQKSMTICHMLLLCVFLRVCVSCREGTDCRLQLNGDPLSGALGKGDATHIRRNGGEPLLGTNCGISVLSTIRELPSRKQC